VIGLPTPLDAFEARRLTLTLLLLSALTSRDVASSEAVDAPPARVDRAQGALPRRRHVRPPRSC
jgi:hypothetical protein